VSTQSLNKNGAIALGRIVTASLLDFHNFPTSLCPA
jgi:hypothetical protein